MDELERLKMQEQKVAAKDNDLSLAKTDPDNYWIDPRDGLCKKRGPAQFFISENGACVQVTKEEYMRRKKYLYKDHSVKDYLSYKAKKPGEVSIAGQGHENFEYGSI